MLSWTINHDWGTNGVSAVAHSVWGDMTARLLRKIHVLLWLLIALVGLILIRLWR
jgi:hypothetical protein